MAIMNMDFQINLKNNKDLCQEQKDIKQESYPGTLQLIIYLF